MSHLIPLSQTWNSTLEISRSEALNHNILLYCNCNIPGLIMIVRFSVASAGLWESHMFPGHRRTPCDLWIHGLQDPKRWWILQASIRVWYVWHKTRPQVQKGLAKFDLNFVAIFVNICSGVVAKFQVFWTLSGPIIRQDLCSVRVLDNFEIVAGENLQQKPVCTWLLLKTLFKMVFNHPNLLPYFIYYYHFTNPFQQPLFLFIASFVGFSARFRLVNLSDFPRRQRRIFLGEKECWVGSARPHLQGRFVASASYRVGLHPP